MSDIHAPVLVPYARFLEVRARRLAIVSELALPDSRCATDPTPSPASRADHNQERVAVRLVADPTSGSQR